MPFYSSLLNTQDAIIIRFITLFQPQAEELASEVRRSQSHDVLELECYCQCDSEAAATVTVTASESTLAPNLNKPQAEAQGNLKSHKRTHTVTCTRAASGT